LGLRYLKDSGMLFFHENTSFPYGFGVYAEAGFEMIIKDNCQGCVGEEDLRQVHP